MSISSTILLNGLELAIVYLSKLSGRVAILYQMVACVSSLAYLLSLLRGSRVLLANRLPVRASHYVFLKEILMSHPLVLHQNHREQS